MPRALSGTYSLATGNPVVNGTTIDATWANNTLNDIATALTDSLSRSGSGAMTAPFQAVAGTALAPALTISSDLDTGIYWPAAGQLAVTLDGSELARFTSAGLGVGQTAPAAVLNASNRVVDAGNSAGGEYVARRSGGGAVLSVGVTSANDGRVWMSTATPLLFGINNAEAARLDASGNFGLGVTPSNWSTEWTSLNIAGNLSLAGRSSNTEELYLSANAFNDGPWKYIASNFATQYYQDAGTHVWRIAPSGTAGTAITFTQAMTLDASGNLGINRTAPAVRLDVNGALGLASSSLINAASYTVLVDDAALRFTTTNCTVTLPAAASFPGRLLFVSNVTANSVTSASSNVCPLGSDTAGTAILAATAGRFALLQSNGTNYKILMAN